MRKSINVETVFGTLTKEVLATGWKARVGDWLSYLSNSAFGSEQWKKYEAAIRGEIEFANANLDLLSENDYKWLLEQQKSPTVNPTNDVTPSFNCKICCDGHFSASAVQGKTIKSDVEVIAEFKKLIPGFTAAADKLKVGDAVATESQKKLWVVQITKGKKVWYKTSGSFKDGYVSPSIDDASLYYTKADAAYFATFIKPGNTRIYNLPFPVKVMLKEVVYTENASRTVELVKPVDSTVKKVRKPKKVYLIQDKKTKQYVTKVDHSNFTEVDLDKDISEARLYTSMGNADSDCKYLSRYKDTNCKVQLEVVEMPDDEKFVLWSNGSLEFFVRIDSTGIRTTKNIDEAARYVSYKSASTAVKKTDKELPYRFSIAPVKNVKPLVLPVEKPVKKVKEPKVKEEWVLYQVVGTHPYYYIAPTNKVTPLLRNATSYPSYAKAANANYNLIKAGEKSFIVEERKNCK